MTVSGVKLSQIASSPSNFASTDTLVGVRNNNTDLQFSFAQIDAGIVSPPFNSIQFNSAGAFGGDANLTWTPGVGLYDRVVNPGAGTTTLAMGVEIDTASAGAGAFTNLRGLQIQDQSGVGTTESYNILSNGTSFRYSASVSSAFPARRRGGNLFVNHCATGNYADIDFVFGSAGDAFNQYVDHERSPMVINEFFDDPQNENDFGLHLNLVAGLAIYPGIRNLSVGTIWSYQGIDEQAFINSDSTGPFQNAGGMSYFFINYGHGNIVNLGGGGGIVNNTPATGFNPAPGIVTNFIGIKSDIYTWGQIGNLMAGMYSVIRLDTGSGFSPLVPVPVAAAYYAEVPSFFSGIVTSLYGVFIGDHSGIGTAASDNIRSSGAASITHFEGTHFQGVDMVIGTGTATNATSGFLYVDSGAGTPTGTPSGHAGTVPMYIDTTNSQLWLYLGGVWKQPKTPAGAALITWQ